MTSYHCNLGCLAGLRNYSNCICRRRSWNENPGKFEKLLRMQKRCCSIKIVQCTLALLIELLKSGCSYGFDIFLHSQMIPGFDQRRDISVKIQNNEQVFMSLNDVHIKLLTN